ncbi:MAG: hypothetical protein JSU89_11650 [Myxococcales bacterium]|nr:MAG: hypothetical protein JSU89_11650 [Myxococcales bacterium]
MGTCFVERLSPIRTSDLMSRSSVLPHGLEEVFTDSSGACLDFVNKIFDKIYTKLRPRLAKTSETPQRDLQRSWEARPDELVVVALRHAAVLPWYGLLGAEVVELRVEKEDVGHLDTEHSFADVVGVADDRENDVGLLLEIELDVVGDVEGLRQNRYNASTTSKATKHGACRRCTTVSSRSEGDADASRGKGSGCQLAVRVVEAGGKSRACNPFPGAGDRVIVEFQRATERVTSWTTTG